jgi:hypothetical protein
MVAVTYGQPTHSIRLSDVRDALGLRSGPLSSRRRAAPRNRTMLSHANKMRPAEKAEKHFWALLEHLGSLSAGLVRGHPGERFARKFNRKVHLADSTTIPLIASCPD